MENTPAIYIEAWILSRRQLIYFSGFANLLAAILCFSVVELGLLSGREGQDAERLGRLSAKRKHASVVDQFEKN
jgi:hypothetical protein